MCVLLTENSGVYVEQNTAFGIAIRTWYCFTFEIAVFFQNSYDFAKFLCILKQLTATNLV